MYVLDADSLKEARITLTLIFINIICFITFTLLLPVEYILQLAQINTRILNNNEYYRLITSMFLHADFMHIFSNMIALLIFGATVENNYSKIEYLLIYFISGLIGNLFSLLLLPMNSISLGASGAIFGLIGAAFILFTMEGDKTIIFLGLLYLIYFIVASLAPGINLWAHLFGLIGGLIFGYVIIKKRKSRIEYY
ncbi:MAG: rhomboid family intramembrane serine protease [Promethearchaeota archaeon]|nr:MAG: rhomboid family intramembrane serine protease [Candidatus Lokiarchaeota archaeon]